MNRLTMSLAAVPRPRAVGKRIGTCDQAQNMLAVFAIDHAGKETARRLARAGAKLRDHARNARGLQAGKLDGQRLTGAADIEQPLAAIVSALFLHDVTFIDQLL